MGNVVLLYVLFCYHFAVVRTKVGRKMGQNILRIWEKGAASLMEN